MALSSRIVQQTLEGLAVSAMPRVRTTDGHLLDWDREAIAKQLLKETSYLNNFTRSRALPRKRPRISLKRWSAGCDG
jgi:hypothetical protein